MAGHLWFPGLVMNARSSSQAVLLEAGARLRRNADG
jgi:hypothetical protein